MTIFEKPGRENTAKTVHIAVLKAAALGADLVVGAAGAISIYDTPLILIDMGTATTMYYIDEKKNFRGGAIMPGVNLSFSALTSGTSLLPGIYIETPEKVIGTDTVGCMQSGAIYGTAEMIDGLIDRMEEELGYPCRYIATGGLASAVIPSCRHEIIYDDDLLLKGLWTLYEKNRKERKDRK